MSDQPSDPHEGFNPATLVADSPAGTVVYGFSWDEDPDNPEAGEVLNIDFIIRESTSTLEQMMHEPDLEIKAGLLEENGVLLAMVLFSFNPKLAVYRTFWNYYDGMESEDAPGTEADHAFDLMATNTPINYLFVGDSKDFEYQLQADHGLQTFFVDARDTARGMPPWTPEAFHEERRRLEADIPDPMFLWKEMG